VSEFQRSPASQWDRMDQLIEELSAIVDELKALRSKT
jgi:hypothetical protein